MHSLFQRTFLAFLTGFLVVLIILAGSLAVGYRQSLRIWSEQRQGMIEQSARELLEEHSGERHGMDMGGRPHDSNRLNDMTRRGMPSDVPVFVYDADGSIIATNRGDGRRREVSTPAERQPVRSGNRIVGYYSVGPVAFRGDDANRALTEALMRAAIAGTALAWIAALGAAWWFSRSLSAPAARVAHGIDSMAHGVPTQPIPAGGTREIARIAQSANLLAERLHSEQALRAQWAQDVTHDLRTPIASIRAQLEAVIDGVYQADPARIAGTLEELARVEGLINDLDELMRLEEPTRSLTITEFDSAGFAAALQQRFAPELQQKQLAWQTAVETPQITADEGLLLRAVSNLVANAIRHADPGSPVALSIRQTDAGQLAIQVCNQGPTVPEEEIPRLFERLYRGEYARGTRGSGLGLTIARRIVRLHAGEITMDSDSSGTVVTISLPGQPAESGFTQSS